MNSASATANFANAPGEIRRRTVAGKHHLPPADIARYNDSRTPGPRVRKEK